MGGNIPDGIFLGGNFPGGDLMDGNFAGENFPRGNFPRTENNMKNAVSWQKMSQTKEWSFKLHYCM